MASRLFFGSAFPSRLSARTVAAKANATSRPIFKDGRIMAIFLPKRFNKARRLRLLIG
jgi:hypothetical protein